MGHMILGYNNYDGYCIGSIAGDFQLSGPSMAQLFMNDTESQFCFNVTILQDNLHDGSTQEQITLAPLSANMPNLLALPLPSVTIYIQDNDSESLSIIYHGVVYYCM